MINFCWYFFKLGIALLAVVVATVGVSLYMRMDSEIRRQVKQVLEAQFPHLNVSVGGARLVENRGIEINDLVISETTADQLQNNLMVIDKIFLDCDIRLKQLMNGQPPLRRVIVRHPQIWVAREADGSFNLASMWPPPECGDSPPQIIVEDARITLIDRQNKQATPIQLRDVNLTIQGVAENVQGDGPIAVTPRITRCEVQGTLGGPYFHEAEFTALCNLAEKSVEVAGKFTDLKVSEELLTWCAGIVGPEVAQVKLQGYVDGEFSASYQFVPGAVPQVDAKLALEQARLEHPRLPRPLTDLSCEIRMQGDTTFVEGLRCNCGSSGLALQLERRGWQKHAPMSLAARAENLLLDEQLYWSLPEFVQDEWSKYKPTGTLDADLQATFDGQIWRPAVTLTGRNLAFEADKFPYRVTDGSGTITYSPPSDTQTSALTIDLTAYGGGQPLQFSGHVFDPKPGALGWLEITGNNVKIEDRMIAALPDKTQQVIRSLRPEGRFNVRWRIDRSLPGQLKPYTSLRLELINCQLNYERFSYPLSGIRGFIQAEDNRWNFRDLVSGGSRNIACQGSLIPTDVGNQLSLQFVGKEIPLDDDLLRALPPSVQKAWTEVKPRGRVDLVAEIYHVTGLMKPSIRVEVRPRPDSTSIEPRFFPYQMNIADGTFSYQDGRVTMSNVSASHSRTTLRTNGSGEFHPDGSWLMQLEGLTVDRLAARRDLLAALPPRVQKIIDQLHPTGNNFAINNGMLRFAKGPDPNPVVKSEWDIQLDCHQTDIQTGIELNNIHGSVRLAGFCDGNRCESTGELALDTVTFQDVQFTDIRGPLWIDDTSCLVGQWACEKQGLPVRHVTARVYDGTLTGDTWITFDQIPKYRTEATIADVNLARLMSERFRGSQVFNGKLAASVSLQGTGRSLNSLTGNGEVRITEANIYELPLLMGLLKVLRNGTPDTTAFNQSDMKFRIRGRDIYLDKLDFLGDAVSLYGQGTTNFDQELQLVFHGVMGRNDFRLPLVKNIVDLTGQQFMQMYVDGTIGNPQIHTQPLPGINQLIQQIQTELDSGMTTTSPVRQADRTSPLLPFRGKQ